MQDKVHLNLIVDPVLMYMPNRYLYTKKAMSYTESVTSQLFDQPIFIVQQLSNIVGWTTLIGLIVVSCLLGVTMLTALLRTYHFSARLPTTTCGEHLASRTVCARRPEMLGISLVYHFMVEMCMPD